MLSILYLLLLSKKYSKEKREEKNKSLNNGAI